MPCHQQCNIRLLNRQLIEIKQEKIFTLRQILHAPTELGRVAPNKGGEVARSKRRIQRDLFQTIAELMYLSNEVSRGCNPCQIP